MRMLSVVVGAPGLAVIRGDMEKALVQEIERAEIGVA
jgi:hypothetical protein